MTHIGETKEYGAELKPCPFCGSAEHLSVSPTGSMTADMPARPYHVRCHHIDHDTVAGPTAFGRAQAIAAWNARRADKPSEAVAWLLSHKELGDRLSLHPITDGDRSLGWVDRPLFTSSEAGGATDEQSRQIIHELAADIRDRLSNEEGSAIWRNAQRIVELSRPQPTATLKGSPQ